MSERARRTNWRVGGRLAASPANLLYPPGGGHGSKNQGDNELLRSPRRRYRRAGLEANPVRADDELGPVHFCNSNTCPKLAASSVNHLSNYQNFYNLFNNDNNNNNNNNNSNHSQGGVASTSVSSSAVASATVLAEPIARHLKISACRNQRSERMAAKRKSRSGEFKLFHSKWWCLAAILMATLVTTVNYGRCFEQESNLAFEASSLLSSDNRVKRPFLADAEHRHSDTKIKDCNQNGVDGLKMNGQQPTMNAQPCKAMKASDAANLIALEGDTHTTSPSTVKNQIGRGGPQLISDEGLLQTGTSEDRDHKSTVARSATTTTINNTSQAQSQPSSSLPSERVATMELVKSSNNLDSSTQLERRDQHQPTALESMSSQPTQLVESTIAHGGLMPTPNFELMAAAGNGAAEPLITAASKKKKKKMVKKKKKKMEKKHKEWKKGKKHKKKKYESKKKKGGMSKKKKGKKEKKKWGMEKKGHKKKGNFKKKKWGHKKKMKKGHKKGKKGHKMLKDKGHKKKGFKKVYHKEEWGKKKKWHDIKREKKWNTKQKKWKKKWHQEKGKKYKGKHMKKYHKKNKHGKKYKKEKKSKWKKHKGEKFKKGHKKKKEEYSKKKEGGKKKKMKKEEKKMKKKKG